MEASQLTLCVQKKKHLLYTYTLLGLGMGMTLSIIFSSIALFSITELSELVEIAGSMTTLYLIIGVSLYAYLERKLKKTEENTLRLAVCEKIITHFQPHLSEVQLFMALKKMMANRFSYHTRAQLLRHYLENQSELESLMLTLVQNQAEAEILAHLGLRWGTWQKISTWF